MKMDINNKKAIENLYKVLRMNIYIKASSDMDESLKEFRKAAKQLDDIDQASYEKKFEEYIYTAITLEEEQKRLEEIINLIKKRLSLRDELVKDFENVTGLSLTEDLKALPSKEEVSKYEMRLDNIKEYLNSQKEIEATKKELIDLTRDLAREEDMKKIHEEKNERLESELLDAFKNAIKDKQYVDLSISEIDSELDKIADRVEETYNTKEVTTKCVKDLEKAGANADSALEYKGFVRDAELNYYNYKEQQFILSIYKLILDIQLTYPNNSLKRESIKKILEERKDLRKQLRIDDHDIFTSLTKLLEEQSKYIQAEKEVLENINRYNERIKYKENNLVKLESLNNRVEILSLLKEFNLIDTYDEEEIEPDYKVTTSISDKDEVSLKEDIDSSQIPVLTPIEIEDTITDNSSEVKEEVKYADNEIKQVIDVPPTMSISLATLKAQAVISKVNRILNADKDKKEEVPVKPQTKEEVKEESKEPKIEFDLAKPIKDDDKKEEQLPINNNITSDLKPQNIPLKTNPIPKETSSILLNNDIKQNDKAFWIPKELNIDLAGLQENLTNPKELNNLNFPGTLNTNNTSIPTGNENSSLKKEDFAFTPSNNATDLNINMAPIGPPFSFGQDYSIVGQPDGKPKSAINVVDVNSSKEA